MPDEKVTDNQDQSTQPTPAQTNPNAGGTDGAGDQGYTESMIKVLEGIEHVRTRPGMYIGDTTARGLHHLILSLIHI